jgi:ribosomal protein S6--L-glutamate ligase
MDLLGRLASRGTPVVNSPRSLEMAIDKYLSLSRLAAAGLPVPRTIVAQQPQSIRAAWESLGSNAVVKPLFGSCGRGIDRLQTVADLEPYVSAAEEAAGKVVYLQEFVPHDGWDARILLVGDEAYAMRRVAADNWRTNLALGARAEAFCPPPDWIDLARRAAAMLETTIAGVDLLPARDGRLLVLEVNAVPGWKGLESVTESDIAGRVVACVERRTGS